MECPKCGSEVKRIMLSNGKGHIDFETFSPVHRCTKCNYDLTYNELEYRERLDKVLSKFEGSEEDTKYYNIIETEQTMINITYREKIFALELFNKNNDDIDDEVISLNTVKSLLKDLGVDDN